MFYKKNRIFNIPGSGDRLSHFLCNIGKGDITPLFFFYNIIPRYSGAYQCIECGVINLEGLTDYNKKYLNPVVFSNIFGEIL
jgi:hypothetical protein